MGSGREGNNICTMCEPVADPGVQISEGFDLNSLAYLP